MGVDLEAEIRRLADRVEELEKENIDLKTRLYMLESDLAKERKELKKKLGYIQSNADLAYYGLGYPHV